MPWETGAFGSFSRVELFGTLGKQTPYAYLFYCEDGTTPVWLGKRVADWDADTSSMTVPRWLARKHGWVKPIPADNDPVWQLVTAALFRPHFYAVVSNPKHRSSIRMARKSKHPPKPKQEDPDEALRRWTRKQIRRIRLP